MVADGNEGSNKDQRHGGGVGSSRRDGLKMQRKVRRSKTGQGVNRKVLHKEIEGKM